MFEKVTAFVWNGRERKLKEVKRLPKIQINELIGIEKQKNLIISNTKSFIEGKRVNNVLLWGERGTGKTTLIKALINNFRESSLRIIQVLKSDIITIPLLYDIVYDHEGFRFIIFLDDLSFNENEGDFRDLKIVMDGGIEEIPENSVIYATSNRRNLLSVSLQGESELFPEDSLQERASLIERFGLRIGFYRFSESEYFEIVKNYAKLHKRKIPEEQLLQKAHEWSLMHGTSGRSAYQFVLSLNVL